MRLVVPSTFQIFPQGKLDFEECQSLFQGHTAQNWQEKEGRLDCLKPGWTPVFPVCLSNVRFGMHEAQEAG